MIRVVLNFCFFHFQEKEKKKLFGWVFIPLNNILGFIFVNEKINIKNMYLVKG